ncbi:MAG: HNH endonuclease, partial [Thermoplasmata archaeon]
MADPIEKVPDAATRAQLVAIRGWYGETLSAAELAAAVRGFQGQKGIYRPAGAEHALWVRQTLRGVYPDEGLNYHSDGSWTFRYAPEGREGRSDLTLPSNRGLLKCQEDGIPVGVFRQKREPGAGVRYEVLGLAFVDRFDGTHFVLRGEAIDWTALPVPDAVIPTFLPFELQPTGTEEISRIVRDHRFGVAVRRIYHERCSLCDVGYRIRGRTVALDAAHIVPVEKQGNIGDVRNGILLCKNHH